MMRTAAILAAIFIAVTAAVHFGYQHLEKKLQQMSCVPQSASQRGTAVDEEPVSPAAEQQSVAAAPAAQVQDFQIIVRRDIFQAGAGAATAAEKTPEPEPVPEAVPTSLNLTLAGTVTGGPESARAIVMNNSGGRKQHLLRIGAKVPKTDAVVKSIAWNKITLEVNGRLEVLPMPKPDKKSFSRRAFSRSAGFTPPPVQEQDENGQPAPPIRPQRRIILPEDLEQAADNMPELPELPGLDMEQQPELPELPGLDMEQQPQEADLPSELLPPDEGNMPKLPEEELPPPME